MRFLFLTTLFIFFSINFSHACMFPKSIEEAIKEHEIIFTGKNIGCFGEQKNPYIKFQVHKIWKGEIKEFYISKYTCHDKGFFKKGKKYLIYAMPSNETEHINISFGVGNCSRSSEIIPFWEKLFKTTDFDPKQDMKVLGKPIHTFETED